MTPSPRKTIRDAITCYAAGNLVETETICRQILEATPEHIDALHLLGVLANQLGKFAIAIDLIGRAIRVKPSAQMFCNLATALQAQGQLDTAAECYRRATLLQPDHAEAHYKRGSMLVGQGQLDQAAASLRQALAFKPDHVEALYYLGTALYMQGRLEEATEYYHRAVSLKPDLVEAHYNLGVTYGQLGKMELAVASYRQAIALKPDYVKAYCNLAAELRAKGEFAAAIACYYQVIALKPDYAQAHANLGFALQEQGKLDPAIASYQQAIALEPDFADAHLNYSLCLLLAGRYAEGWREYEWRWQRPRNFAQPFWRGEALAGKTVLVYDEQGHGDGIQFLRFVPLLKPYGGKVILEILEPLHALIRESIAVDALLARGEPLPPFDCHISLLSLPRLFQTTLHDIPAAPYLRAPAERLEHWRRRLATEGLRVGLTWAGNPDVKTDECRSPRIWPTLPLLDVSGVTFYGIQMGDGRRDLATCGALPSNFVDLGDDIHDFADTAAILSQLDLLITPDTSVAHLAGALGKKTWVMLHATPDWRWMLERSDSPWYPSLTLYRQAALNRWQDVIQKMLADLEKLVRQTV